MALVLVVIHGAAMFSEIGLRDSIIQSDRGEDQRFLNTAWTLQILRGVFLWGIIAVLAGPVSEFYNEPRLATILPVSGLIPLIQGFNSVRLATYSRHLKLERLVAIQLVSQTLGVVIIVLLAWWLKSIWALVLGSLVGPALLTAASP